LEQLAALEQAAHAQGFLVSAKPRDLPREHRADAEASQDLDDVSHTTPLVSTPLPSACSPDSRPGAVNSGNVRRATAGWG